MTVIAAQTIKEIAGQGKLRSIEGYENFSIYALSDTWVKDALSADPDCCTANTVTEFEMACSNPAVQTILINKHTFGPVMALRVMQRTNIEKTVILEIDHHE